MFWVYYTIPFGFSLFWHFRVSVFYFWKHSVWRRVTDEGSLPTMRIWSILLIKSELKRCMYPQRSLFIFLLYFTFNYLVSVTAGGPVSSQGHMQPSSTFDFGWFVVFWEHVNFSLKNLNCNFVGLLHHSFWLQLVFGTFGSTFSTFETTLFGEGSLMRVQYPKYAYGPYC